MPWSPARSKAFAIVEALPRAAGASDPQREDLGVGRDAGDADAVVAPAAIVPVTWVPWPWYRLAVPSDGSLSGPAVGSASRVELQLTKSRPRASSTKPSLSSSTPFVAFACPSASVPLSPALRGERALEVGMTEGRARVDDGDRLAGAGRQVPRVDDVDVVARRAAGRARVLQSPQPRPLRVVRGGVHRDVGLGVAHAGLGLERAEGLRKRRPGWASTTSVFGSRRVATWSTPASSRPAAPGGRDPRLTGDDDLTNALVVQALDGGRGSLGRRGGRSGDSDEER